MRQDSEGDPGLHSRRDVLRSLKNGALLGGMVLAGCASPPESGATGQPPDHSSVYPRPSARNEHLRDAAIMEGVWAERERRAAARAKEIASLFPAECLQATDIENGRGFGQVVLFREYRDGDGRYHKIEQRWLTMVPVCDLPDDKSEWLDSGNLRLAEIDFRNRYGTFSVSIDRQAADDPTGALTDVRATGYDSGDPNAFDRALVDAYNTARIIRYPQSK